MKYLIQAITELKDCHGHDIWQQSERLRNYQKQAWGMHSGQILEALPQVLGKVLKHNQNIDLHKNIVLHRVATWDGYGIQLHVASCTLQEYNNIIVYISYTLSEKLVM